MSIFFWWEDLYFFWFGPSSLDKTSEQGRFLCLQCPCIKSPREVSRQNFHRSLHTGSVGTIGVGAFSAFFFNKISTRDLLANFLYVFKDVQGHFVIFFASKFMGEDWTIIPGPLFPTSLFSQMHVVFFPNVRESPRHRNANGHFTTTTWCGIHKGNARRFSQASFLCKTAKSKCTWTFHKNNFAWKCSENWPKIGRTRMIPLLKLIQCGHTVPTQRNKEKIMRESFKNYSRVSTRLWNIFFWNNFPGKNSRGGGPTNVHVGISKS